MTTPFNIPITNLFEMIEIYTRIIYFCFIIQNIVLYLYSINGHFISKGGC